MRALEAAGNTTHPTEIKKWHIENQEITVIDKNGKAHFTLRQHGLDRAIPACDVIGIPKNIDLSMLKAFLADTGVRVAQLGEHGYKLYIQPRLNGGANITGDEEHENLWPQGIVPYEIDTTKYPVGEKGRQIILKAIQKWNAAGTGFQFVARTNQSDVLVFGEDPEACYSDVGRQGGAQYIRCHLHGNVFDVASIMHEIGHAIGFYHEQQRSDRDNYVQITKKDRNGKTQPLTSRQDKADFAVEGNQFGRYDFYSIMHYPINVALTGNITITPLPSVAVRRPEEVGVAATLSPGDITAAKHLSKRSKQVPLSSQYAAIERISNPARSAVRSRTPEYVTMRDSGDFEFSQKNYQRAFAYYSALITEYGSELKADFLAALYNRCGTCHFHLHRYQDAKICYKDALKIEPTNRLFKENYQYVLQKEGDLYFEYKKYDEAFDCYRLLIENYNEFLSSASRVKLNNRCGICCAQLEDYDSARSWYRAALKIEPHNPVVIRNYQQLMN